MIAGPEDYWIHPDGTRHECGDTIPVIRINGLVLFNEFIIKGTCDMCEWACLGPTSLVHDASQAHISTHIMQELEEMSSFPKDWQDHPDFKE
tara:strand:+ start:1390 stop:1665 length:276 start_codon:yes stop_codon:yes gene_type:complete